MKNTKQNFYSENISKVLSVIICGLFMFLFFYLPITANADSVTSIPTFALDSTTLKSTSTTDMRALNTTSTPSLAETEATVKKFFADDPIMISVAKCESGFRQFNDDDTVLLGHGLYVGIFQIDPKIHGDFAKSLSMDIYTVQGNLDYAKYLKSRSGLAPWPYCSQKALGLTLSLKIGTNHTQVLTVQQLLNNAGFILAQSGPGSLGNETTYFGLLTRSAVRRFQCAKGIVCSGTESTTGYGNVGPLTRAAILKTLATN